jgi:protein-disulfide isomerase
LDWRDLPAERPRSPAATPGVRRRITYSDTDCPFCGTFARDTLPGLREAYIDGGKVLFVFRHLPLERIHPQAKQAAEAMECAGQQGRLFDLHDRLFERPKQSDAVTIAAHVKSLGLDTKRFAACMTNSGGASRVADDIASARALGVTGTPTFLIGLTVPNSNVLLRQRVTGALPLDRWRPILDKWLSEAASTAK